MAQQVQDDKKYTANRLPNSIKPVHYDLWLRPNLKEFTFEGTVKIGFTLQESVREVTLHSHNLVISDGHLVQGDQKRPLTKVTYSNTTETATLDFGDQVKESGSIFLTFKGCLNDKMKGFYRTAFDIKDSNGQDVKVFAATTQFESTDARQCLPCWDEPAVKATFSTTLCYDPNFYSAINSSVETVALSNTPIISKSKSETHENEINVLFAKTPIMSTYLLAFIIAPLEFIEDYAGPHLVRVYTKPGSKERGRFALEVGCKSILFYENYFNIKYPLEKLDMVAVPDFCSGAMENWGLVTYRETVLLVDPENTATMNKQYVALVVAHELAHQWFGNLVTMEWWTHLWLNEGFATFMEYLCVNHIAPEFDIWSQFVTDCYVSAMDLDSLRNSHPIEVPVHNASEIEEIFDNISYNKGSSVIRMLYEYIGDESFKKGMHQYLTKFAYKNAQTEDLWASLEAASNKPITKLMSYWTQQQGYPWLSVSPKATSGDDVTLSLTQCKFTADGTLTPEDSKVTWSIPLATLTSANPTKQSPFTLMEGKTSELLVEKAKDGWIKLNPGTIGLYRTAYSPEMTDKLTKALSEQALQPMDRLGLQYDQFALCQAGNVSTVDLLQLLKAYKNETDYTVWSSIDGCIGRLSTLFAETDFKGKFSTFGQELYSEIFKRFSWEAKAGEKHTDPLTRSLVINRLVSLEDQSVIDESRKRFKAHLDKTQVIPADLRGAIYKAVSSFGDDSDFDKLFEVYKSSDLQEEKVRILRALGCTKDAKRISRVSEFLFSGQVRNQDMISVFVPMAHVNPAVAWKLFKERDMLKIIGPSHLLTALVKYTTKNFVTEERALEVIEFFETNKYPGCERTIKQSVETIRISASWLARDSEALRKYLSA